MKDSKKRPNFTDGSVNMITGLPPGLHNVPVTSSPRTTVQPMAKSASTNQALIRNGF